MSDTAHPAPLVPEISPALVASLSDASLPWRARTPPAGWPACVPTSAAAGWLRGQIQEAGGLTHTGNVLGTPNSMAPEQAAGRADEIGPAADVFGLGAILYHLLTGRPPHRGTDLRTTLREAAAGRVVPPRQVNPWVPRPRTHLQSCARSWPRREGETWGWAGWARPRCCCRRGARSRRDVATPPGGPPSCCPATGSEAGGWIRRNEVLSRAGVNRERTRGLPPLDPRGPD